MTTDILICGAGAAGLTLALDLARRHVSFTLVDQADTPFTGARGKRIQPRSLEIFDTLGVVDRMAAAGGYDEHPPVVASAPSPASRYTHALVHFEQDRDKQGVTARLATPRGAVTVRARAWA